MLRQTHCINIDLNMLECIVPIKTKMHKYPYFGKITTSFQRCVCMYVCSIHIKCIHLRLWVTGTWVTVSATQLMNIHSYPRCIIHTTMNSPLSLSFSHAHTSVHFVQNHKCVFLLTWTDILTVHIRMDTQANKNERKTDTEEVSQMDTFPLLMLASVHIVVR